MTALVWMDDGGGGTKVITVEEGVRVKVVGLGIDSESCTD